MRFAADEWLWGVFFSLLLAAILAVQGFRLARDRRKFANDERISELLTAKTGLRRAVQAVLSCLAVALAFVAAAQPQYGKGTRVLPATNLDVVIVLDYSKSMYARDISPSRIGRAKIEVGKLIRELGGARFAAVAFAGESMSFPLTSDGSAIAQFFQGLEPNDMPVGGTAIARALETGRQLLERDPLSKNHERVMILVTDGEDLEGDPVAVAQDAQADGIRVDVVQIGGQSPEPIPDIDETGATRGLRKDTSGRILTTALTPEGEAQLTEVAKMGGGKLVRAAHGETGIGELTNELRTLMSEKLSERVETVFADVYFYPLSLAVLLLLMETWVGTAKKRVVFVDPPKGHVKKRKPRRLRTTAALLALSCLGCSEFDSLFERESPVVNRAIELLQAKTPDESSEILIEYLETGPCEEGVIGAGDRARKMSDASFDLALALSKMGDSPSSGTTPPGITPPGTAPPGTAPLDPTAPPPSPTPEGASPGTTDCALRLLGAISGDRTKSAELRARAHYVAANLEMRRENFADAVAAYDQALLLAPGVSAEQLSKGPLKGTKADPLGISIAHNRALALRLKQQKEEQEQEEKEQQEENQTSEDDQSQENDQEEQDDQNDSQGDDPEEKQDEEGEQDKQDESQPPDDSNQDDSEQSDKNEPEGDEQETSESGQPPPSQEEQDTGPDDQNKGQASQSPSEARDQRMLDLLEQAPTLQEHRAKEQKNQGVRVRSTMEDK